VSGLPRFSTLYHKSMILEKKIIERKCVFWFSLQCLSENFLILTRIKRDIIIIVFMSLCKVAVMLVKF
jgi:hypothetical protein